MAPAGYGDRVEGTHAVAAALAAGRVVRLLVERRRIARPDVSDIVARAEVAGASVEVVEDVRPHASTSAPQGLVAVCRPIAARTLRELCADERPALLVVDHVEDPHNLGAMARSAVAAGMGRLVVPGRRGAPLGGAAFKAAAGALEHCSVAVVSSIPAALSELKGLGLWTVGLDVGVGHSIIGLGLLSEPLALVVGGEGGLHRLVRERCDVLAAIPMADEVESLNASVAAALACFEVRRVREWGESDGQG